MNGSTNNNKEYKSQVYNKWKELTKQGKIFQMSVEEGIIVQEMHAAAQKKDKELEKRAAEIRRRYGNKISGKIFDAFSNY